MRLFALLTNRPDNLSDHRRPNPLKEFKRSDTPPAETRFLAGGKR